MTRPVVAPLIVLFLVVAPLAVRAESGMCEYRHPSHPKWDFFASCSYSETTTPEATPREVRVSNGSKFSAVTGAAGDSINGLAARRQERDDAACWRTLGENELICIYPADTLRPAVQEAGVPEPSVSGSAPMGVASTFGGGTRGYCLLVEAGKLVEQGACIKRENCLEEGAGAEIGEGTSCLTSYDWASGRITEMARAANWVTLDGAMVIQGDPGCFVDTEAAITFCHAPKAMTARTHPILAQVAQDNPDAP
ncbi:MAG TPA: hypothetical protein ENK83_01190, partial [Aliiroseovarius sp.]|nr:hypothetical protein [Aliiroseovarius sp.]